MDRKLKSSIIQGDCEKVLKKFPDNCFDLIMTSPPYADSRKKIYGGPSPSGYVEWFLPKSEEFLRVLKPRGTFILNIKERVVNGERHTYVIDLIKELKNQGWLWTEEYIWYKKIVIRVNGKIGLEILGRDVFNLTNQKILRCIKMM